MIWGVERSLFFLAAITGGATFNFFGSLAGGILMFVALFIFASWATRTDPKLLQILLNSAAFKTHYDSGKYAPRNRRGTPRNTLSGAWKDYREAGALNALVSISTAVDDDIFATKCGGLVQFLWMEGLDAECLERAQLDHVARRFESAVRGFDEHYRLSLPDQAGLAAYSSPGL